MFCGGDFWVESWLQRRWTEHRGVSEGQQTCRLICTWHCFQIISLVLRPILGSSKEKADGQREGRKESAIFILMRAFWTHAGLQAGAPKVTPSMSMETECITQRKEVPNIIRSGEREKTFLKNKNTLCSCLKKKTLFQRWRIWFQLMSHPCGFFSPT